MAKNENAAARAFCSGSFAPFAKALAILGADTLFYEQSFAAVFAVGIEEGAPILVVPHPEPNKLVFTTLYKPKMAHFTADLLAEITDHTQRLVGNWKKHCSAYVTAVIDLLEVKPFYCLDHNGTGPAAHRLLRHDLVGGNDCLFGMFVDGAVDYMTSYHEHRLGGRPLDPRIDQMHFADVYKPN